ncbi:MAG: hypothetical protein A2X36_03630 [Elusimicrobia bacterium GWA2_69_24]|nr:MAG: hypothetical protein A2X36_03630 [Elusimicrobia bacterium GWA2_69_24]HBL15613.1 hypothetical protein [Elusimicrobiota bacterium]
MGLALYAYLAVALWVSLFAVILAARFASANIRYLRARSRPRAAEEALGYRQALRETLGLRRLLKSPTVATAGFLLVALAAGSIASIAGTNSLRDGIRGADRLVIRSGGMRHRRPDREKVLFETVSPEVLRALSVRLTLGRLLMGSECLCFGDMTFEFYRGAAKLGAFSYHHYQHVRIEDSSLGDRDLSILSNIRLLRWLQAHGVLEKLAAAQKERS